MWGIVRAGSGHGVQHVAPTAEGCGAMTGGVAASKGHGIECRIPDAQWLWLTGLRGKKTAGREMHNHKRHALTLHRASPYRAGG